jgi:dynein intermediate chain
VLQHPELLLASYSSNEDSANMPDGVALVWNIRYKKDTPEFVFHCQVSLDVLQKLYKVMTTEMNKSR